MKKRRQRPPLPAPEQSDKMLVELLPRSVGMFRFLLEAHDNLAGFTVLNRHTALIKVFFSPHQRGAVLEALRAMQEVIALRVRPWPTVAEPAQNGDGSNF